MAARVMVVTGPARSGKTQRLLGLYRRALGEGRADCTLWLAPTHRSVADIISRLPGPELPACFRPGVMTFENFAREVLEASGLPFRPLPALMKRQLIRFLIQQQRQAGRLKHFASIADTHGLVDLAGSFITELKRLEIWPEDFRQACEARGLRDKDRELLAIYEAYQQRLRDHQLYDAEGRFWSARDLLTSGQTRPFERLRLVVVDGFTDFTRTQHEILAVLAERADEMYVSLPLEPEPRREDLFAKSLQTVEKLKSVVAIESSPHAPREEARHAQRDGDSDWLAMDHLHAELFMNPRHARQAESAERIEITGASRQRGEVEQIGRQVKRLLSAGCDASAGKPVRPGDIAVVFRSLQEVAPLVREVFGELGLPLAIDAQERLEETPLAAAVVAMLRLSVDDWPFRQLLAVLGNNYFAPNWPEWNDSHHDGKAAAAAERVVRSFQIPSGAQALLKAIGRRVERLRKRLADESAISDERLRQRLGRELDDAEMALPLLRRLDRALGQLPAEATQAEWAEVLRQLGEELGVIHAAALGDSKTVARDQIAWNRLLGAVRDGGELFAKIGEASPKLTPAAFLDLLLDLSRWQRLPRGSDDVGRVRVLSAASVRALCVPYLFFAGLSERAFPSPERQDRLYSEGEYAQLREKTPELPLPLKHERSQEEMLLFYEVLSRATRQLWLSYPALDDRAEPLLPSPYLREVERACGERRVPHQTVADLSPVPRGDEGPQSQRDFRIRAVDQALAGDAGLLAALPGNGQGSLRQNVLDGLTLTRERGGRQYGQFEGILAGDAARAEIAAEFGPQRRWSVSHLEQYALCPHKFFLERVLGLKPLDELTLQPDYLQRGSLLHDLLAALHERINAELGEPTSPGEYNPRQFEEDVADIIGGLLGQAGAEHEVQAALREIDRRIVVRWAENFRQQHKAYDARWQGFDHPPRPAHFEVSFGLGRVSSDPLSTTEPVELSHEGETLLLGGRIDRLDVGERDGETVFNIIDYKSGLARAIRRNQETPDGRQLQLELYALAAEQVLLADRQAKSLSAGYWYVRKEGFRPWEQFHEPGPDGLAVTESWRTRRQLILDRVVALVRGIRSAEFPMHSADDHCTGWCEFRTVCRVNHARALEKVWEPPG